MKRLLRISLDTLLMSIIPILTWLILGYTVDKNIANIFSLTYCIQFVYALLLTLFGIGANINATKNNKKNVVDSNIIFGIFIGLIITIILVLNVDKYIEFMSMDANTYREYSIYSFTLMFFQYIIQLICHKLYYTNNNKKANIITLVFNLLNFVLIILLSYILKEKSTAIIITLFIDLMIIIYFCINNIQNCNFEIDIKKSINYTLGDIVNRLCMFLIYFIGDMQSFAFGAIYLTSINFEALITDTQWDITHSYATTSKIDSSKNQLNYKQSLKDAYKLTIGLVISTILMGLALYNGYKPLLWFTLCIVGVQITDLLVIPSVTIKKCYLQINYSSKKVAFHEFISKGIRIFTSFIPTPFCTYIGQTGSMIYQLIIYNVVYKKIYKIENGMLLLKEEK